MSKGKSFLSAPEKTASGDEKRHLRIVITNPDAEFNQVVVSVTTLKYPNVQDCSCVLKAGDHRFITHDSIVDYKRTIIMSSVEIFNGINKGILIDKQDVKPEILKRIINAAKQSRYIPPEIKSMIL